MAISNIRRNGSTLMVYNDDGSIQTALKTGANFWQVQGGKTPDPDPDPDPNTDPITITNCEGLSFTFGGEADSLEDHRMDYAVEIYGMALALDLTPELQKRAGIAAFMTCLVESTFLMYASTVYPETETVPHDAVGNDRDSVGLYQQRPQSGWGEPLQLMELPYTTEAFWGTNEASPPGLLEMDGWETGDLGAWCQAVQVSAHPDRYSCWESGATELWEHIAAGGGGSSEWVWPYPLDEVTSEFRPPGRPTHDGMDFSGAHSAATGAPIPSAAAGTVREILAPGGNHGFGNGIQILHADGSVTLYAHMFEPPSDLNGHTYAVGDKVDVRDTLGGINNTGNSFGNHLHFETHPTENPWEPINPRDFMAERNAKEPTYQSQIGSISHSQPHNTQRGQNG